MREGFRPHDKIHPLIERKLAMIVEGRDGDPIVGPGEHPPCFDTVKSYHDWLEALENTKQIGVPVPPRKKWPGEPNYCYDCSNEHRNRMRAAGRCLFPSTMFIAGKDDPDELVGSEGM